MSSVFLEQAKLLLSQIEIDDLKIKEAKDLINSFEKTASVSDLINDPKFQNVVTLLTPFVVNYKVNQVINLLKELAKDKVKIDPQTGLKRYI